ncbi:hypothetical protein Pla175_15840 [Pirellulimonas nuda]|uniref:Tetratricopeptide repeat protein n=1 Tax=Pirellulimonas nuda TaxID=2528009 RepID=A0A518D9Q0_9BACT|nr:hypothetical protein [Pirellulimonas nuda]QDU88212.1 hypothetical protein Pla175_15840 [Pirellulimonas nuda]
MTRRYCMLRPIFLSGLLVSCLPVEGADLSAAMVESLRSDGHYDEAIEFLDRAGQDPLASDAFRARVPYERALTLLDQASKQLTGAARDAAVARASRDLESFAKTSNNAELSAEATSRLALARLDAGRQLAATAETLPSAERAAQLKQARAEFDRSREMFDQSETLFDKALDQYKAVKSDSPEAQRRLDLRNQLAQARLLRGRALLEQARTFPAGSKQRKELGQQAADELADLYEKYSRWTVGFYAHLYEGQAYELAEQTKLAEGAYLDLTELLAEVDELQPLVTLAHAYLVGTRLASGEADTAAQAGKQALDALSAAQLDRPESLALKYQVAMAQLQLAEAQRNAGQAQKLRLSARGLLRDASSRGNEFITDAKLALADLSAKLGDSDEEPENFAQAYQAGRDAFSAVAAAKLGARLAAGNNQEAIEQLNAQAREAERNAESKLAAALLLVDDETDVKQINDARYLLSYLRYENEEYYRAAVLGSYIAQQYPDDPNAEKGAKVALASLEQLYRQAGEDAAGGFESRSLAEMAGFVTRRWPGSTTADAAFTVLLSLAIRENRLSEARAVIDSVEPAQRAQFELKLAAALWEQSLKSPDDAALHAEAIEALQTSFAAARGGGATQPAATAALYLAQARLDEDQAAEALKLLQDPKLGPLTLVRRGDPAVARDGYDVETYKAALRAYVSATPPQTDEALKVMGSLEKSLGASSPRLATIYFGLGVQLQRQVARLTEMGRSAEADRVSSAFAAILDRLSSRGGGADWTKQQWIAVTYYNLAEGMAGEKQTAYFKKASDQFARMIELAGSDPTFAPSDTSVLAARMQFGQCQRKLGEYEQALETFAGLLAEREAMLDVQKAAAYTYQEWATADDAGMFKLAISGGRPAPETGKNTVWGWSKLASVAGRVMRSNPKFRDTFFEAWLNIARSRYLEAEKAAEPRRAQLLESAQRTITALMQQYPDLGGETSEAQFDQLMKAIQKAEGQPTDGLKALRS